MERCGECGSWGVECGNEKPVADCGCARCLREENALLRAEVKEVIAHYEQLLSGARELLDTEGRLFDVRQAEAKYDNERVLRLRDREEREALSRDYIRLSERAERLACELDELGDTYVREVKRNASNAASEAAVVKGLGRKAKLPACDGCGAAFGAGCECVGNSRAIGRGERREP